MWRGSCSSALGSWSYGRHAVPEGNLWELLENSRLFWFTEHLERAYIYTEREGHCFGCDHWPWSRSLCGVEHILSLVFQRKSENDAFSGTLSIKAGVFFFFIKMQRLLMYWDSCLAVQIWAHATWPSIHTFFFVLTIHSFPCSLFTCLLPPDTLLLSLHHHPPFVLHPVFHISWLPPPKTQLFASPSTVSPPPNPSPAGNCFNSLLRNSDQPLCVPRRFAKPSFRLINSSIGCG